jgi:hypothetical protein
VARVDEREKGVFEVRAAGGERGEGKEVGTRKERRRRWIRMRN